MKSKYIFTEICCMHKQNEKAKKHRKKIRWETAIKQQMEKKGENKIKFSFQTKYTIEYEIHAATAVVKAPTNRQ